MASTLRTLESNKFVLKEGKKKRKKKRKKKEKKKEKEKVIRWVMKTHVGSVWEGQRAAQAVPPLTTTMTK